MTRNTVLKFALISTVLGASTDVMADAAADAQQEVAKQVARQISLAIEKRIRSSATSVGAYGGIGAPPGEGLNVWLNPQYTDLGNYRVPESTSIYAMVGGADTRLDNFFFGASATYSRAEFSGFGSNFNSNSYGLSPYAGYLFNENVFATAILGYNRSDPSFGDSSNGLLADFSLNGVLPVNNFDLTGKAGYRTIYSEFVTSENLPSSWINTYYMGGQIGYRIDQFRPYFSSTWEHYDPKNGADDSDLVFSTLGVDYQIQDAINVGVYYTRELTTNGGLNYNAAGANFKMKF